MKILILFLASAFCAASLSACAAIERDLAKTFGDSPEESARERDIAASQTTTIGVNAYLWRAAVDTVSFAPLLQADANSGVIITDWYVNPSAPGERVKLTVHQTAFTLFVNTTTALGTALVLGVGGYFALQGRLTVGQLLVVMSYLAMVYRPLEQISTTLGALQQQVASLRVAYDLLDEEPDIKDRPDARDLEDIHGAITFDRVSFSYAGRTNTLEHICFHAAPGQVVALVGPTGAGKTTLVSLLPRFYEATAGRLLVDGTDIRQITLRSLRRQMSIVLQEPLLFARGGFGKFVPGDGK